MRRQNTLILLAAAVVAVAQPGTTAVALAEPRPASIEAADRAAPASVTRTVALENDRVVAWSIDYPSGAAVPEHRHAVPRVVVVLAGGSLEFRDTGGAVRRVELKAGEVAWRPPETHSIVNVGTTPVRVVEIDLRDAPPRGKAAAPEPRTGS